MNLSRIDSVVREVIEKQMLVEAEE